MVRECRRAREAQLRWSDYTVKVSFRGKGQKPSQQTADALNSPASPLSLEYGFWIPLALRQYRQGVEEVLIGWIGRARMRLGWLGEVLEGSSCRT